MPSVTVVLLSHHFQLLQPYSAVETGRTFFSLPSCIFTFFPPSLAKPGTSAAAGGGKLNLYDAIRSSVHQSFTLRTNGGLPFAARVSALTVPIGVRPDIISILSS